MSSPTNFYKIFDMFLSSVTDYKLDELYAVSTTDLDTRLQGFLMKSIPKFTNCKTDLTKYVLTTDSYFEDTLTLNEINILSDLMLIQWFEKEINDVTQFTLQLNNTDFKTYSQAQNLKAKQDRSDNLREKVSQDMVDYGLKKLDWEAWQNGTFTV